MATTLLALAILPAIVLLYVVYKEDKIEKEPIGLLVKLVIFGGLTVISAAILESVFCAVLSSLLNSVVLGATVPGLPFLYLRNEQMFCCY